MPVSMRVSPPDLADNCHSLEPRLHFQFMRRLQVTLSAAKLGAGAGALHDRIT